MKRTMILTICLALAWCLGTAYAVEPEQCFDWNGRVLRVVEVLDGDAVTPLGDEAPEGRYVQLVISCEGEPLTWGLQREITAVLQNAAGTEYRAHHISGSFADGVGLDINNMDSAEMKPEFTMQFDLPQEIAPADCTLSIEDTADSTGIPAELVGTWVGTGMPDNGSSPIELEAVVNADGTGEYRFEQSGYIESYPFTLSSADSSFTVNIPADNYLGITECGGTYAFDGETLTLDITTRFDGGRSFSYTAVCTRQEEAAEPSAEEAEAAVSDDAATTQPSVPNIQPVVPKIDPVVPKIQPVVPKIDPVVPKIQPVVPKIQPVVPKIQPVVPNIQPVITGVGTAQAAEEEPAEEASAEPAVEAELLPSAADGFEVDGIRLKADMFTRDESFIEQEFSPMPANGMVLLLRLNCVDSKLKTEQIESLGTHFRIEYPESGTQMSVIGCEADTTDADDLHDCFDVIFYSEEWISPDEAAVDDITLFCDDTAYSLAGISDQGEPLETTPVLQLKLQDYRDKYSEDALEIADGEPVFAGKLLIALSFTESGANPVDIEEGYYDIPVEWLAKDFDEADTLIFIRSIKRQVGTYIGIGGGAANETTTQIEAIDLHSGRAYEPYIVAVNQPPQTITVQTINGVPMSSGGSGKFEEEMAAQYILENHVEYVAQPTPEPTPESTPEPEPEPETEAVGTSVGASSVNEVLDALGEDVYRTTYDALLSGEIIQSGSKGDTAKGVQHTLVAFGQGIAVDGSIGPKTIAALNTVQAAFGLDKTESLDAAGYAELLPRLLITVDPDEADALLLGQMNSGEYNYMRACAMIARGKYASAKTLFEESGWGDWETRVEACVQPWPKTGQLYKNSAVKGSSSQLTVKFNSDPDIAMLVKIYTTDGILARTMFIAGNSKATTSLPAGTYIVKDGTGKNWYGEEESFGSEGSYEIMTFDDGQQEVQFMKNYASTITVNVEEPDPTGDTVGSEWESWGDF